MNDKPLSREQICTRLGWGMSPACNDWPDEVLKMLQEERYACAEIANRIDDAETASAEILARGKRPNAIPITADDAPEKVKDGHWDRTPRSIPRTTSKYLTTRHLLFMVLPIGQHNPHINPLPLLPLCKSRHWDNLLHLKHPLSHHQIWSMTAATKSTCPNFVLDQIRFS